MMQQHLDESTSVILSAVPRPRPRLRALPPAASAAPRLALAPSADPLAALGGLYTAPFGFVLHPLVNQQARSVPLVLDSAADLTAISRALRLVGAEGGFDARLRHVWRLEARIRLSARAAPEVTSRLSERTTELTQIATRAIPACARGEAPLALEILPPSAGDVRLRLQLEAIESEPLVSHLHDAARALAPVLHHIAGARPSVRISSKSIERVCVSCHVSRDRLLASALSQAGGERPPGSARAIERAAAALALGARDVAIASAHNAMIEHGVAAVALALGSAPGRVTGAVEQHAMRWGRCAPLCNWRVRDEVVEGELELPLDIPTQGRRRVDAPNAGSRRDPLTAAPQPELDPSRDIALLAACIGMCASLIALEDAVRARALEPRGSVPPPRRRPATAVRASLPSPAVRCGRPPERKARPLSAKPPSPHPAASSPASRRRGSTIPPRAR